MPFTFSHAAVVLPYLKNKKLSATALIAGTMSPDFEYFFRMKMQSQISHTFIGIFILDLPLALMVMFLFHQIIKRSLIQNLPAFFQKRMYELANSNWLTYFKNNAFIVFYSFILGTLTHILWDSITHWDGFLVQRSTFLSSSLYGIPLYSLAQHLSSLIGMICILYFFYRLPESKEDTHLINWKYWLWSLFSTVVFFAIRLSFGIQQDEIATIVVSLISSGVLGLSVGGLVFKNNRIITS
ncbi:DUF4184 family protein [Flavobacterium sp. NG2]|uniref:DUF4184 family protein n=1 Tax=Flavobacterium sp. NG2 TaxID=3097547 RepID=UPI002A8321BD|nr:DUF4184 family protein [Flavobacterium sp. NG2]WPR72488.1 DUF4184 family protein [Flavobacterium sp. NG2]